jgi:hypothetical protein
VVVIACDGHATPIGSSVLGIRNVEERAPRAGAVRRG